MRAVTNFHETIGLTSAPDIVGVGYSGGSIATGWAAQLQPTYAPELSIKGWSSGGTPANITGVSVFVDNTAVSGFLPAALNGLSRNSSYGATLKPLIDSIITPYGQAYLDFANVNCGPADILAFTGQSIFETHFQTKGRDLLYDPAFQYVLADCLMGQRKNETPTAPVFMFHANNDEIIPYENATTLYNEWCDFGADVQFTTYGSGGHLTTEVVSLLAQLEFTASAFAGTVPGGCSMKTSLNNTLNPLDFALDLEPIVVNLLTVLLNLGEQDANLLENIAGLHNTSGVQS